MSKTHLKTQQIDELLLLDRNWEIVDEIVDCGPEDGQHDIGAKAYKLETYEPTGNEEEDEKAKYKIKKQLLTARSRRIA